MNYKLLITLLLLSITGCNDDRDPIAKSRAAKKECEFGNGARAFIGLPANNCNTHLTPDGRVELMYECLIYPTVLYVKVLSATERRAVEGAQFTADSYGIPHTGIICTVQEE